MAGNVFGNPVTDDVVKLIYPDREVTPKLRAQVAFQYINTDGRDVNCQNFVHNLKKDYGTGYSILGTIFNCTGDTLTFVNHKDWHGEVWKSPYPAKIQNGQWGGFLFIHSTLHGAEGAVVYRGNNGDGVGCEWLLSWDDPLAGGNRAHTDINQAYHYDNVDWGDVKSTLETKSTSDNKTWNGCYSTVTIASGTSPGFTGIISLEGALRLEGAGSFPIQADE